MALLTLTEWLVLNPDHLKFSGTVSGSPLSFQAAEGIPDMAAGMWRVVDITETIPELTQSAATVDVSTTGSIAHSLIPAVPEAPSATEIIIPLGQDTDAGLARVKEFIDAHNEAIATGKNFYLMTFMGLDKLADVYAASVTVSADIRGTLFGRWETVIAVTPNLGAYHKLAKVIA